MKNIFYIFFATLFIVSCNNDNGDNKFTANNAAYQNAIVKPITLAIEANPDNAALYYQRSIALHKIAQDSLSALDLRKAVVLDADNMEYRESLALLYLDQNMPDSSLKQIYLLQQKDKTKLLYKVYEAEALLNAKRIPQAQRLADTLLNQFPDHPLVLLDASKIKAAAQDTVAALALAMKAVHVAPDFYDGMYQIADLYNSSDNEKAIEWYNRLYHLDTLNAQPLFDAASFYKRKKNTNAQKLFLIRTIETDRDFTEAYMEYGKLLLQEDSVEKAKRQFHIAIQVAPNHAEAYYYKGISAERLGEKKEAAALFQQTLIFNNNYKEAAEHLSRLNENSSKGL